MTLSSVITNPNRSTAHPAHLVRHAAIREGTVTHVLKPLCNPCPEVRHYGLTSPAGCRLSLLVQGGALRAPRGPAPMQPQALARGVRPAGRSPRGARRAPEAGGRA